jgi:hypothetical protein
MNAIVYLILCLTYSGDKIFGKDTGSGTPVLAVILSTVEYQ